MRIVKIVLLALCIAGSAATAAAQTGPGLLKRTVTKTDRFDFGSGGTVSITGAPNGSIKVIGSETHQIEITATVSLEAPTEADLGTMGAVTSFITDESAIRTAIISVGSHNKFGSKQIWKKFPKHLRTMPYRIDYLISVPKFTDLEIDGGKGDLSVSGVEGGLRINFLESAAKVEVIGGNTSITVENGAVDVAFGTRGWKARAANIQVGKGDLSVQFPATLSADIDAIVLRTGVIENSLAELKPRDRKVAFTDRSILAKAGVGGPSLKFTVGDGKLRRGRLAAKPL